MTIAPVKRKILRDEFAKIENPNFVFVEDPLSETISADDFIDRTHLNEDANIKVKKKFINYIERSEGREFKILKKI